MRTEAIIFLFPLVFQVWASHFPIPSNEILVREAMNLDLTNETRISTIPDEEEDSLYQDVVDLAKLYIPSFVYDLIEYIQNENLWELTKAQFWRLISFVIGYDSEAEGRSGQSWSRTTSTGPLFTIPFVNYPVTQDQVEGFVLDSFAVYKKWSTNTK